MTNTVDVLLRNFFKAFYKDGIKKFQWDNSFLATTQIIELCEPLSKANIFIMRHPFMFSLVAQGEMLLSFKDPLSC